MRLVRLPSPLFFEFQFQGDQFVKNISNLSAFSAVFTPRSDPRKASFTHGHLRDCPTRLLTYLCLVLLLPFFSRRGVEQPFDAEAIRETPSSSSHEVGRAPQTTDAHQDFLIQHVRVFDGEHITGRTSVLVRSGRIEAVGPHLHSPKGIRVIDGRCHTLLPGLIDAHTHIRSRQDLEQSLAFGVTTDLSMLMDLKLAAEEKSEQSANKANDRADLFSSGYSATAPGGHGTEYGMKFPTLSGPQEAQAWVDARIAEGSDYIKIMYEYGGDTGHGGRPSIDKATLEALIAAAHARGKLAVVHIHSERQAMDAIEANADGLAHLFSHGGEKVDPRFAPLVAAHHAFVIPTFTVLESVCNQNPGQRILDDQDLSPFVLPSYIPQLERNINHGQPDHCMFSMTAIPPLAAAHVPILAGTDLGNPGTTAGASLHGELEYLVEAGLTPVQALVAATSAPADSFRLRDRGRIVPGLRADLLLVKGDPATDIRATRNILAIWKAGVMFDRQAWRNREPYGIGTN
jgi:imidazolonepropionase-like amidohydrolase